MLSIRKAVATLTTSIALISSGGVRAEDLTLADLQGITVHSSNRFSGNMRNEKGDAPARIELRSQTKVGPGALITSTTTRYVSADTPRGVKTGQLERSYSSELGAPTKAPDGSGDFVWVLQGNSLVRLRTLQSGGVLFKIEFTKTPNGLTCKAESAFARETGGGKIRDTAAIGGGKVEVLDIRQTGSSCKVTSG